MLHAVTKNDAPAGTDLAWIEVDPRNCSIGHALATVGDRWSLLVLRELAFDVDRFDTIQAHLDVSRRTLTERLDTLVARGIVERLPYKEPGQRTRHRYQLTPTGADLLPVLFALAAWGNQHRPDDTEPPVIMVHHGCGAPVALQLRCSAGHEIRGAEDVEASNGPGAVPIRPG